MTTQSDIKKLAEQIATSMKSFDDIKDFQRQECFSSYKPQHISHPQKRFL